MAKKNYSLKVKLSLPIILTTTVVFGAMTYFMANHSWNSSIANATSTTLGTARAAANDMKAEIQNSLGIARTLAHNLESLKLQKQTNREIVRTIISDSLRLNPYLVGTWTSWEPNAWDGNDELYKNTPFHDATGRFIPYSSFIDNKIVTNTLEGYETPGVGDFYVVPRNRKKETMVEPYMYQVGNEMVMMTSAVTPIIINEKFVGVAGVDLSLGTVQTKVNQIKPFDTSEAYLISASGSYVSHPNSELISKPAVFQAEAKKFEEGLKGQSEFTIIAREPNGEEYLYTGTPFTMGNTDQYWTLLTKTPMTTIVADSKAMLWKIIGVSLVGTLLVLVAIMWLASHITGILNDIVRGLGQESTVVTSSSEEVASASVKISESSTQQAASLQETVASIEEISAMVARNAENASNSVTKSEISARAAEKGKEKARQMLRSIESISNSNDLTIHHMQEATNEFTEVVQVIQDIAAKTEVINEIVFQTKLLSFNASVEAARAGESGKGFAVVAEEIGSLATMSGKAANEISEIVTQSIAKVTSTVDKVKTNMEKMMHESKQKVEEGMITSKECDAALEDILVNVSNVNEMIKDISTASHEQTQGIGEINKAMNELDQATQSSTKVAYESSQTARELMDQANRLKQLVAKLNELATGEDKLAS